MLKKRPKLNKKKVEKNFGLTWLNCTKDNTTQRQTKKLQTLRVNNLMSNDETRKIKSIS
jgi:hypothetical protein